MAFYTSSDYISHSSDYMRLNERCFLEEVANCAQMRGTCGFREGVQQNVCYSSRFGHIQRSITILDAVFYVGSGTSFEELKDHTLGNTSWMEKTKRTYNENQRWET